MVAWKFVCGPTIRIYASGVADCDTSLLTATDRESSMLADAEWHLERDSGGRNAKHNLLRFLIPLEEH